MTVRRILTTLCICFVTTAAPTSGRAQPAETPPATQPTVEAETTFLLYRVNLDEAVRARLEALASDIEARLAESGLRGTVTLADETTLRVEVTDPLDPLSLLATLADLPAQLRLESAQVAAVSLEPGEADRLRESAMTMTLTTLERRFDDLGVVASVIWVGGDGLLVSVPEVPAEGVDDLAEVVAPQGLLEVRPVHDDDALYGGRVARAMGEALPVDLVDGYLQSEDPEALRALAEQLSRPGGAVDVATAPPPGGRLVLQPVTIDRSRGADSSTEVDEPAHRLRLIVDAGGLDGDHVRDVTVAYDELSLRPFLNINFDDEGGALLCELTEATVGRELAIVLDGVVGVAPTVREPICGGRVRLDLGSASGTEDAFREAQELAVVLRRGALRAPLTLLFEGRGAFPGPAERAALEMAGVPPSAPGPDAEPGASGGAVGAPCLSADDCASRVCEGEGCGDDRPGVCAPAPSERRCTRDLRSYCDCEGHTFRTSGSCPGRRFAHRGACHSRSPGSSSP